MTRGLQFDLSFHVFRYSRAVRYIVFYPQLYRNCNIYKGNIILIKSFCKGYFILTTSGYVPANEGGLILPVGYGRGPEMALRLEKNNIICNYQAVPDEEGFTASGALRMGVSEMTRFGMEETDFQELASLIKDVVVKNAHVKDRVTKMRQRFMDLGFCFSYNEFGSLMNTLHNLV